MLSGLELADVVLVMAAAQFQLGLTGRVQAADQALDFQHERFRQIRLAAEQLLKSHGPTASFIFQCFPWFLSSGSWNDIIE